VLRTPLCEAQSFLKEKVRGNAERLKYWEMSRSRKNGLGFAKTKFWEKDFAKPRLIFFESGGDFEFRPRGGRVWEGIRAGFSFLFWRDSQNTQYLNFGY